MKEVNALEKEINKDEKNSLNCSPSDKQIEGSKNSGDGGEIVQKAPHYQNIPLRDRNGNVVELEAWEIITSLLDYMNLNPMASWAMGDALKYLLRCGRKFGDIATGNNKQEKAVQDLRKATYYINKVADWYFEGKEN